MCRSPGTLRDSKGRIYQLANDWADARISDRVLKNACQSTGLKQSPDAILAKLEEYLRHKGPTHGRAAILGAFKLGQQYRTHGPWTKIFKRLCAEGRIIRYKRGDPQRGPTLFAHVDHTRCHL